MTVSELPSGDVSGFARKPVGRPRDPAIDVSVLDAAKAVYAEVGWAGFSFETVARRAGVGKSAIYRRWASREELLIAAVSTVDVRPYLREQKTFRDALAWLIGHQMSWWSVTSARAYSQLAIDRGANPVLSQLYVDRVVMPLVEGVREVVARAEASGEIRPGVPAVLIVECLIGAVGARMYAIATDERLTALLENPDWYVDQLTSFLVGGVGGVGEWAERSKRADQDGSKRRSARSKD